MTLTLIVGREGSGKTTFVNDVYRLMNRKCTYLRQKPVVRPYIPVCQIADFDPSQLPFWNIYQQNSTADTVKLGGTLAGKFTEGLTEGQRNLLLFELICQRAKDYSDLLIALDEPFDSGVHEDFVPYIIDRLSQLTRNHNIILVMNDRLGAVRSLANNIIILSDACNRSVLVNDKEVDCEKLIHAVSMGGNYTSFKSTTALLKLFFNVEVKSNKSIWKIFFFSSLFFSLFILGLWNTDEENDPMLLVAAGIISYICVVPYLLSLVEWRNAVQQETDTLLQDSPGQIKILKLVLILAIVVVVSLMEFGVLNAFIDHLSGFKFWVSILCDNLSIITMFVCLGLYTHIMSFQAVQVIGFLPFFFMVVSGTMLSPGSGVPGLKVFRYIYPRFYFWCMVGSIDSMEGCPPEDNNMVYLILSTFMWPFIFLVAMGIKRTRETIEKKKLQDRRTRMFNRKLLQLQTELFGGSSKRNRTISPHRGSDSATSSDTQSCGEDRASLLRNSENPDVEKDGEKEEEMVIFAGSNSAQSNEITDTLDALFVDPFLCAEDKERCSCADELIESSQPTRDDKETVVCHPIRNPVDPEDSSSSATGSSPGWSDSRNISTSSSSGGSHGPGTGDRYEDAIRCDDGDTLEDFLACSENSKSSSEYMDTSNSNDSFYDEESNTSSSLASSSASTTISRKSRSRKQAEVVRVEV